MSGTLFGIGVGPGDPELMTVKAWRLVSMAETIAYLCANGSESTALSIAKPFLPETYEAIAIDMPMRVEREPAQEAYDNGAKRILAVLDTGKDVVFLCEGDPLFYASFMYLFERLRQSQKVVIVPGVTSITAAAAELGQPLAERDEILKVLPATLSSSDLKRELATSNSAAIIKVGRHFGKVKSVLNELALDGTAISYATQERQTIASLANIETETLPYFTTILVKRK